MKNYNEVVPTPTGQKMFVTANRHEKFVSRGGILLPTGTMNVELLDVQEVVEVGLYLKAEAKNGQVTIEPGDIVHINFNSPSFYKVKTTDSFENRDDNSGIQDTMRKNRPEFGIPVFTFSGVDYLLIDKNDVDFTWKQDSLSELPEIDN